LTFEDMVAIEPKLTKDVMNYLSVEGAAKARTSFGGTAPDEVRRQIATARATYKLQ
ncbi:MAG: argininosuccinate lyase, partial [Candidatus Puniceispirillaceae bacterium]